MPARGGFNKPPVVYPPGCKEISPEQSKEELLKRLKLLAKAFQEMEQDDNAQYKGLAGHLASELLLDHSSKDVKLLVACCIADIFRIFAPEAPYQDDHHIKEIFMFFVDQLRGLEDTEAPSFKRCFYLLENLAWVKSFNICLEMEDNQEIFCRLYKLLFGIVDAKHTSKVKNFMLDMMCPLITEADSVSQELLDIILLQIIELNKTQHEEAYQLAKDLIRRTANAIEPYITAFFNNALMLGKTSESEVSDHLFHLIYELNQISPSVLLAVLPQLEYKLKSNDDKERKLVTRLLSKMFSDKNSDLAESNKSLWLCYLGRFNDINIQVRTVCVKQSQNFILNHPELIPEITVHLKKRLHDPDENVRMECVLALNNAAKKDLRCVDNELLELIKDRTLDKKFRIRKEALQGLGMIYKSCLVREEPDEEEMKRIGWIRDKILHGYYQMNLDDRIVIERIFKLCLVPCSMDPDTRMKTLYHLYVNLDDNAVKALNEMFRCQSAVVTLIRQFIEVLEKEEETADVKNMVAAKVMALTRMLPEQSRNHDNMKKLAHMVKEDGHLRQNLLTLVSQQCSCKKSEECVKEILKKMGSATPQNVMYTSVRMLMERIAPVHIDVTAMKILMKLVNDSVSGIADIDDDVHDCGYKGMKLLLTLSTVFPGAFGSDDIYRNLLPFFESEVEDIVDLTIQIFKNTGAKIQDEHEEVYETMKPVLVSLAKEGTPEQAKHAVQCINTICHEKQNILAEVFDVLKQSLDPDAKNFQTALVSLGHIAQMCPGEFSVQMKNTIVKTIVKDLLMKNRERAAKKNLVEPWTSDEKLPRDILSKLCAMKTMVRWLIGLKNKGDMADKSGKSTLRMLYTTILHDGDLMETGLLSKGEMARLRLQAACCILKLAQEPVYADMISQEQFQGLAVVINDDSHEVRTRFTAKLHKGLMNLRLRLEYMSIFCLAANDPIKERRVQAKSQLASNINKRREILKKQVGANELMHTLLPDYVLPYVIHLLAHDPEFRDLDDVDVIINLKACLCFIIEPLIQKNDNYSFNFYNKILDNMKQMRDAQDPENEVANHKLYAVCDLAMGLLVTKSTSFVLKDFPMEPVLPKKLFIAQEKGALPNTDFYLPPQFAFSPPKKKQATALMHGAAQIAPKPNKLLNGVVDSESPASPASVTSNKSDKTNDSKASKKEPAKKEAARRRQTKPKGPDAKKSRLSSPPDVAESPAGNGTSPSSSGESGPSSVKLVKKPAGKLVQARLSFSSNSEKENVKSPTEKNSGNSKRAAKDVSKGDNKKAKKVDSDDEDSGDEDDALETSASSDVDDKPTKKTTGKAKKDNTAKAKKDSDETAKKGNAGKAKNDNAGKAKKGASEAAKKDNTGKAKKDTSAATAKKDNSDETKKDTSVKGKNVKEKNVQNKSPQKTTPKVVKRTVSRSSARSSSESPMKGSRSSSQESTRSSRGSITVKLSPKKKSPKTKKVVSKKTITSVKNTKMVSKKTVAKTVAKKSPTKPSPLKTKSSPNKKTVPPKTNKGKGSPSKAVNGTNRKKSVSSSPSKSSTSSTRSRPGMASPRNSSVKKVTKSPASSPKVGQKRPAAGNSKNASPAKKSKPTAVKKVVKNLTPELNKARKRSLSSASESPARKSKVTKSGSQSSTPQIPSTSSSKSPSPQKTIPSKSLPPKKRPNVRRAGITNGTSDGSSSPSSSGSSSTPRKSPRKPVPNKKFKDIDEVVTSTGAGIKRKTRKVLKR